MQKWMEGKRDAAFKKWRASAETARKLSMPWEEANALREIGKHSTGEPRREHLQKAFDLFSSSHAKYDAGETKKLLEI